MNIKEYCSKNWENLICFGAAGMMVLIGVVAFICLFAAR